MIENKRKYQKFLEANEDLEYEINEMNKFINEMKISNLNQLSETENMQSEVKFNIIFINILFFVKIVLFYYITKKCMHRCWLFK